MKKLIILCILALCLTACSKSKENPAAKNKTVDLGETTQEESADNDDSKKDGDKKDDSKDKKKADSPDKNKKNKAAKKGDADNDGSAKNDDSKKKKADKPNPDDKAKKDADKKDDGSKDDVQKDDAKPKKDVKEKDADAQAADEGFDFSNEEPDAGNAADVKEPAVVKDEKPAPPKQPRPVRSPKPKTGLNIENYINIRELREQTGYSGALSESWLLGQYDDRYSSARLATENNDELGFSIQIWKPGNESAAQKRFSDLYTQSFGGQKIKSVATDAFVSHHHKIQEVGFYEKNKRATVLLSCSDNICTQEQLKSIAQIIQRRL